MEFSSDKGFQIIVKFAILLDYSGNLSIPSEHTKQTDKNVTKARILVPCLIIYEEEV